MYKRTEVIQITIEYAENDLLDFFNLHIVETPLNIVGIVTDLHDDFFQEEAVSVIVNNEDNLPHLFFIDYRDIVEYFEEKGLEQVIVTMTDNVMTVTGVKINS